MDSLLANYASSGEEEEETHNQSSASFLSSLPPPKAASLFSSLPQPKQQPQHQPSKPYTHRDVNNDTTTSAVEDSVKSSSSLFSSLPQPKSNSNSSLPQPKRVIQFKPPPYLKPPNFHEEDDDEEEEDQKQRRESEPLQSSSSVKSFLSSIPAPKNSSTLGVIPSAAGSGRRSIVETEAPTGSSSADSEQEIEPPVDQNSVNYGIYDASYLNYESGVPGEEGNYAHYGSHGFETDPNASGGVGGSYGGYASYEGHGNYSEYGQYESSNWGEGSGAVMAEATGAGAGEGALRARGKRGRNEIPTEIVEVKQDELMKDRPREDQVKLTGIAFGPSYQPVSNKGKPSKLHKRKHQIGSLYFDMKHKEMELAERRAKGFLTKAETHAKYGW